MTEKHRPKAREIASLPKLGTIALTSESGKITSGNGAEPVGKAITLVELQKDLANLKKGLETLQRQVVAQMGAIQYIQGKIQQLDKPESKSAKV